jgi:hypothetical protein
MNLPGLYHQNAMKRMAAGELARQARRPACDPRTAYEKGVEAEKLAVEAERLSDHLRGNEQVMQGLAQTIAYLQKSPHQSRHRSLAVTSLENAFARLLLENGEPEAEVKFEAVKSNPKPKNGLKS